MDDIAKCAIGDRSYLAVPRSENDTAVRITPFVAAAAAGSGLGTGSARQLIALLAAR